MANLWQNITGTVKTAFKIGRTNTATLDASGLTASRAQALPDKAGTLVVQLASGKIDGVTNGTATGEALTFDAIGVSVQAYSASTTLLGNTVTGTGSIVLATSPTLVTPVLGVASATSLTATSTTEQLRLGYDGSNYLSTTVSSSGAVTFDSVGASAGFSFSDSVAIGVATPLYPLHVNLSSGDNQLYVSSGTPSSVAGDSYLTLGSSRADTGVGHICKIRSVAVSAGKADLAFLTQPSNGVYTERMRVDNAGNVGLGTTSPSARVHAISTTEQLRLGFDSSNYYSTTVSSAGAVTFDAVGASAGFMFSDAVTARSSLTLGVSSTTTGSLVLCGSGGANTHTIKAAAIPEATNSYVWPSASPTASQVLTASAPATGVVTLSWATNGVGDVVGPASSVTGAASVFSGTTGKLLRASPTVTYYSVSAGAEDKIEFGATFKDFRTATDGATVTFDLDLSDQWQVTFAGNRTLAISNASVGQVITILRYQDATGNRTPTWWANIAWDNGLAPVDVPTASGWSMTVLACVGLDAYSVPNWKEVSRSTSAPRTGITTATDGATVTFDLRVSPRQKVTLAGNRTLALTSGSYYVGQTFDIKITQDATGSRTVTWWSAIKWTGGTIPTLTTTAGKSDWFRFVCTDASGSPTFDILGTSMNLGA